MTDYKALTDILVTKGKVRGKPVAVSLFKDRIPPGYEPIQDTPCSIIHYAMDEGRKVYFDADHHDCLVGVHHAGIVPGNAGDRQRRIPFQNQHLLHLRRCRAS